MRIQHNITAMNAYRNYNNNTSALGKNLEKLSSGYRINRAGDDAAGLAISEKMRAQITGLNAASKNVKDGISLVQTAEGAMQEIHDMLGRMKYLATQSANGTYQNEVDRDNLQKEVDSLLDEIDRIADSANFNGQKLLDGSMGGGASKVVLGGNIQGTKTDATKGSFAVGSFTLASKVEDGKTYSVTVSLKDGKSFTAKVTGAITGSGSTVNALVDANGNVVAALASGGTNDDILKALGSQLQNSGLSKDFSIAVVSGGFKFENLKSGADAPVIGAIDGLNGDGTVVAGTLSGTAGKAQITNISSVTNFTGDNFDDAVFTINGQKFIAIDPANSNISVGNFELGKDVTVLTAGDLAGTLKAIKDKTGLDVKLDAAGTGLDLSAGKGKGLNLQIGDTSDNFNQMQVKVRDMHSKSLGLKGLDISTPDGAKSSIDVVMDAINAVSSTRGDLGAVQNRLEHTSNNLSVMSENIQDAESTIRDTDVADEMMKYTKNNILIQSAQAMLAQANQMPQGVLQLLQ